MPTSFSHIALCLVTLPLPLLQLLQNCYCYFCHCYRYFHTTLLLNTLLQILSYTGLVELTTQLLILENILWLLRESWIRGVRIAGLPSSAELSSAGLSSSTGLQDYEDTRLKTSSRVRMGLSLAWKASLAIRICRSLTIVTDSV